MEKQIKHSWFYPHTPQVVWECLTDSELLSEWLMKNDFKPIVGHKFQFNTEPRIKFGFDGIVYCTVLEVVPQQRLSYSWKGGPGNGKVVLDSIVTWTLVPKNGGTELTLEHSGFKGMKNYFIYLMMNNGWGGKIRKRFAELLNRVGHEA